MDASREAVARVSSVSRLKLKPPLVVYILFPSSLVLQGWWTLVQTVAPLPREIIRRSVHIFVRFSGRFSACTARVSVSALCHPSREHTTLRILSHTEYFGDERRRPIRNTAAKAASWTCTGQPSTHTSSSTETNPSEPPTPPPEPTPNRTTTPEPRSTPT